MPGPWVWHCAGNGSPRRTTRRPPRGGLHGFPECCREVQHPHRPGAITICGHRLARQGTGLRIEGIRDAPRGRCNCCAPPWRFIRLGGWQETRAHPRNACRRKAAFDVQGQGGTRQGQRATGYTQQGRHRDIVCGTWGFGCGAARAGGAMDAGAVRAKVRGVVRPKGRGLLAAIAKPKQRGENKEDEGQDQNRLAPVPEY